MRTSPAEVGAKPEPSDRIAGVGLRLDEGSAAGAAISHCPHCQHSIRMLPVATAVFNSYSNSYSGLQFNVGDLGNLGNALPVPGRGEHPPGRYADRASVDRLVFVGDVEA